MRQLLNTLFITSEDIYAALEGENIVLKRDGKDSLRFYNLGNRYETRIEHFGAKASYDPEGFLEV